MMRRTLVLTVLAALAVTLLFGSACFAGVVSDPNCCPDGSLAIVNPVQVYVVDEESNLPLKGAMVVLSGPGGYNVTKYTNSKGYTGVFTNLKLVGEYYADVTITGREPVRQVLKIDNLEKLCEPILLRVAIESCVDRSLEVCVWDDTDPSNPVPLSGASVTVNGQNPTYTAAKTTPAGGCVLFKPISAGTYTVNVSASGYQTVNPVTVSLDKCEKFPVRIGLKQICPAPSMKVCVYDQDNPATPITGAAVTVTKNGGTPASLSTTASGCVTFANLTAGAYTVSASATGYLAAEPVSVTISPSECVKQVQIFLKEKPCEMPSMRVCLYDQDNPTMPITGSYVTIGKNGMLPISKSTTGGCATFTELTAGIYTVLPTAAGYETGSMTNVIIEADDCLKQVNIYLKRESCEERSLQVYVFDNNTRKPVPGATVVITNGAYRVTTITDANGKIPAINGNELADGTYTVVVNAEGYNSSTATGVFLPSSCGTLSFNIGLQDCCTNCTKNQGSLQVIVYDQNTKAFVRGASVRVTGPGGYNVTKYTNSKGATGLYSGAAIMGTYNINVTQAGYKSATSSIQMNSAQATNYVVEIYLEKQ